MWVFHPFLAHVSELGIDGITTWHNRIPCGVNHSHTVILYHIPSQARSLTYSPLLFHSNRTIRNLPRGIWRYNIWGWFVEFGNESVKSITVVITTAYTGRALMLSRGNSTVSLTITTARPRVPISLTPTRAIMPARGLSQAVAFGRQVYPWLAGQKWSCMIMVLVNWMVVSVIHLNNTHDLLIAIPWNIWWPLNSSWISGQFLW